ncbi:MAG: hypothetical protein AB7G25_02475 [Sphingomonadaceae bacterium]
MTAATVGKGWVRKPRHRAQKRFVQFPNETIDFIDVESFSLTQDQLDQILTLVGPKNVGCTSVFPDTLNDIGSDYRTWAERPLDSKSVARDQLWKLAQLAKRIADGPPDRELRILDWRGHFCAIDGLCYDHLLRVLRLKDARLADAALLMHADFNATQWSVIASAAVEAASMPAAGDYRNNSLVLAVGRLCQLYEIQTKKRATFKSLRVGDCTAPGSEMARLACLFFSFVDPGVTPQAVMTCVKRYVLSALDPRPWEQPAQC